jgi:Flp pilus assembly protein TadB
MWKEVGLCLLVAAVTAGETMVAVRERRAERQTNSCPDNRFSKRAAFWAMMFEALLLVDVLATVFNPLVIFPVVVVTAGLTEYWELERRRKKFRARVRKPRRKEVA